MSYVKVLAVTVLLIFFLICVSNSEGFRGIAGGVIPLVKQPSKKKPIVNTPIEDLRSRLKVFKDVAIPEFLCYNFDILSTVEDQGKICGSCWAFVVSGVMCGQEVWG